MSLSLQNILDKIHPKLQADKDGFVFDFPNYGNCLTQAEISKLTPEHVDAIQHGVSVYQDKPVSKDRWVELVTAQYNTIVPPRQSVKIRK